MGALLCILILILVAAPGISFAEPVRILADRITYDDGEKHLTAEGDVQATQGERVITAPFVELLVPDDRLTASGGVTLRQGGDRLTAERVSIHLPSGTGVLEKGRGRFAPLDTGQGGRLPFVIAAERIERVGERDYVVDHGSFTTCDDPSPPWTIDAGHADLTLEGYGRATDVTFRVAGVPLFWAPWLLVPVKSERQSGLLFPRFGTSSTKGVTYAQPLYLVISPSADTTVTPRIESRRGWGVEGEFRYLRPGSSRGIITGRVDDRWKGSHGRGSLSATWVESPHASVATRGGVTLVSDRTYFRDYGLENGEYNRDAVESVAAIEGRSRRGLLAVGSRTTRELTTSRPGEPVQYLPFLNGRILPAPIGVENLYGTIAADLVSFSRPGSDVVRGVLTPSLSLDGYLIPGALLRLEGGARLTGYRDSSGEERGNVRYQGELSLSSGFERDFGMVRHSIFPRVGYRTLQKRGVTSPVPVDTLDTEPGGERLFAEIATAFERSSSDQGGVTTRRDLARFRVSQELDLSGRTTDPLPVVPPTDRLRDLRLEGTILPLKGISLDVDTRYNPARSVVSSTFVSLTLDDPHRVRGNIGWYEARGRFSYLEGGVTIPLHPLSVGWQFRYSPDSHDMLESVTRLDYRHQCWGFGVSYRERNGEREFMFSVTLAGIGSGGRTP